MYRDRIRWPGWPRDWWTGWSRATHNHEPEPLDWPFDRFVEAARNSPRPCRVCPQIWPTGQAWTEEAGSKHPPESVLKRVRQILEQGADGIYFFNFCCFYRIASAWMLSVWLFSV